jgi:hypothetical protein
MGGYRTALAAVLLVAACGGNPFVIEDDDGTPLDPEDPNTSVNSKFAWDPENNLTMNAVTYDRANNQLVINNLPFDGPEGRYDNRFTMSNGARVYESRQTATTGLVKHYAVFIESEHMQATAAAGANWIQYGNAGANINRSSFNLPAGGEYVYVGAYAANRTFDKRSGIELVSGEVELLVDVLDFDPEDGIQGDIVGTVYNRTRVNLSGREYGRDLPDIFLAEVSFDTTNGTFGENPEETTEAGEAGTFTPEGEQWSTGTYGGLFGGPAGQELGGFLVMEGVADIQVVTYEVVTYEVGTAQFTSSGLDATTLETLQARINAGQTLPTLLNAPATIPPDAVNIIRQLYSIEVSTDYNAREIGVFIGQQQPGP